MRLLFYLILLSLFIACKEDILVKPSAQLRLEYPKTSYKTIQTDCPFLFSSNYITTIENTKKCNINIEYPNMKATIYLNYIKMKNGKQIDSLLLDAQKLTDKHTIKATSIIEQPRIDSKNKVYGMFYSINGNAATHTQFYATDSINHFLSGSVYFNVKPNYDSLYPAIVYLRKDVKKIMETLEWK